MQADCCKVHELFDKRTPSLLKLEFFGHRIVALTPKTYICNKEQNRRIKLASKGLSTKLNKFHMDTYLNVLKTKRSRLGTNKGFVCKNHQVFTYTQKRAGLSFFYNKWKVLEDGITTIPLDL